MRKSPAIADAADDEPVTLARLERALVTAAYIVLRHGPAYAPILERLENEVAEFKRREDPIERARRLIDAYTVDGGRKAILSSQSRF